MKWFAKMERKFGKYAIHGLMRYVAAVSVAGSLIGLINPEIYFNYLSLDIYQILHGQVWRLVTFALYPSVAANGSGIFIDVFLYGLMLYIFLWIGGILEQAWGSFRFNAFYFSGIFLMLLVSFVYYFVVVSASGSGLAPAVGYSLATQFNLENLNYSMFLVFAFLFPDTQFLLYFIVPVKAKWLGIIDLVVYGIQIVQCFQARTVSSFMAMFLIMALLVNFVVFYLIARNPQGIGAAVRQRKRRVVYRNTAAEQKDMPRHRCAICGRTEKDSPQLEFRYCSKCEGNYEYCSDHLFTHEHVRRDHLK